MPNPLPNPSWLAAALLLGPCLLDAQTTASRPRQSLPPIRAVPHDRCNCAPSRPPIGMRQVELAERAFTSRQTAALWRAIDRAIQATPAGPSGAGTRARLRRLLSRLGPVFLPAKLAQATPERRVRAFLRHGRSYMHAGRRTALVHLLAHEPAAERALRCEARTNPAWPQRLLALQALAVRAGDGNRSFALRALAHDKSGELRRRLAEHLRPNAAEHDVLTIAAGLEHACADVRVHTADALALLGHARGAQSLAAAAPRMAVGLTASGGTTATRGHVAFVSQQSYVRDVDVEVASAAFVADPKVDVVQTGAVLDATVRDVATVRRIHHAYRRALRRLIGRDPGRNAARWQQVVEQTLATNRRAARRG